MSKSNTTPQNADVPEEGTPVSVKIRERLLAARRRFNANDNIAEFIEPGELERLLDEEADTLSELESFTGVHIKFRVEAQYTQEQYDVVLV